MTFILACLLATTFSLGVCVGHTIYNNYPHLVGEIIHPDMFDPDPRVECTHGIHFFITRNEAKEYA